MASVGSLQQHASQVDECESHCQMHVRHTMKSDQQGRQLEGCNYPACLQWRGWERVEISLAMLVSAARSTHETRNTPKEPTKVHMLVLQPHSILLLGNLEGALTRSC